MRRTFSPSLLVAVLLLLSACSKKESAPPVRPDSFYTPTSRFISGLKQLETNAFSPLEEKPEWQIFAARFDESWRKVDEKRMTPMRQWSQTELTEANATSQDVFYPFSGPDFLSAYTFFPKARNYILIGLEPPGEIPELQKMNEKALLEYLASSYNALNNLFRQSYFITKEMVRDLHNASITGAAPVILVFMARTHNSIVSLKSVAVNVEGKVIEVDPKVAAKDATLKKTRGVRIDFLPDGETEARTLYYFSVDLQDESLKTNPGFVKYLDGLGPVTTYVKSASYLMHYLTFSIVRNECLKDSSFLLQDDSGIAYRFFDKSLWNIRLYGTYTNPIREFQSQFEKDLAKAYMDPNVQQLPFALGYNTSVGGVNLLLATKMRSTSDHKRL